MLVSVTINGSRRDLDVEPGEPLTAVLRERCGIDSVRHDCADGTCGACTVLVDGTAIRSCLMLAVQCDGASLRTHEGLASRPAPAACCGAGMIMLAAGALDHDPGLAADPGRLHRLLAANACRSPGHEGARHAVVTAFSSAG